MEPWISELSMFGPEQDKLSRYSQRKPTISESLGMLLSRLLDVCTRRWTQV